MRDIYQSEVVKGKLPVTIGRQQSTVALGLAIGFTYTPILMT